MKYIKILTIILLSSVISFYACNDKADARKKEAREAVETANPSTTTIAPPPNPATPEPAQNALGVWHYTCNKGCAGGAGATGTCATCGGPLAHNTAYHANTNGTATTPPITQPATPPPPSAAQNAAGVWHYTCGKGCAGGAGAAGNCGTCGGALAHNAAYHQ